MPILLTLAGRKFSGGTFNGGALVQLATDGTWSELAAANTVFWRLKNFINGDVHTLWHIRADGFAALNSPDNGTLQRSVDQGATWTDVTPNDSGNGEFARDIAQDADGDLWLTTDEREKPDTVGTNQPSYVYKSTDNGENWTLKYTTIVHAFSRNYQMYNITCHPTDADIVLVEGRSMINGEARMWRTTDGGDNFSRFTPSTPSPPIQIVNTGGSKMHIFDYTLAGDLVWAGIFETANDEIFVLKSLDDGDTFGLYHTEADVQGYGASFHEDTLAYMLHANDLFESAAPIGQGQVTKIADNNDSPFTTDHDFHGLSRHTTPAGVDTLHIGCNVGAPSVTVTEDPSVFTRPADLSSDWVEHPNFANMDSDLGYRLYVAIDGLVGATAFEEEVPVPPRVAEPPGGGGPIGEPTAGEPSIGEARKPRERRGLRGLRGLRGRRGFKAGPIGSRLPPAAPGEQIDKSVPDEYEEKPVRKWLTFGWLTAPMLEGQKTITLRDWGTTEGLWWQHGELFYAYDTPPVEGGKRLALLRVMQVPFVEFTAGLKMADYHKLGYSWAMANNLLSPSGRTGLQVWEDLHNKPERLWLLRFQVERIFEQGRKEQDTVNVGIPRRI